MGISFQVKRFQIVLWLKPLEISKVQKSIPPGFSSPFSYWVQRRFCFVSDHTKITKNHDFETGNEISSHNLKGLVVNTVEL